MTAASNSEARKRRLEDAAQHAANRETTWREFAEEKAAEVGELRAKYVALREAVAGLADEYRAALNAGPTRSDDERRAVVGIVLDLEAALLTEGAESDG